MTQVEQLVHETTLLGAIDSYMGTLVRVRPHLAAAFGAVLEDFSTHWLNAGYPNQLDAITANWVSAYLASVEDRQAALQALHDFFAWTIRQRLITQNPLVPRGAGVLF